MWWVLAQTHSSDTGESYPEDYFEVSHGVSPLSYIWDFLWGIPFWLYLPFVIWMAVYCARNDSESRIWLWIILLFQPVGAFVYFLVRWLPSTQLTMPKALRRFTRGGEVRRLEIAASQIGNAHQFVELGDLLRELGKWDKAGEAYSQALKKDGSSLPALWGAACVDFHEQRYEAARHKLAQLVERDIAYKFGDVSLMYAKSLHALGDDGAAREHLELHTRRWRHPEALFLLATILAEQGDSQGARGYLQSMIADIESSPRAIARRFFFWKGRARRMLRKLPAV